MNDELLAIVDPNDQVIGVRTRKDIHAQGLLHRAVHILVFDQNGQLFLQKRSQQKDINAGLWDTSAAGHVDAGENYDTCAIRELQEELGITGVKLTPLFKLPAVPTTGMEFIQVYRCLYEGPFKLAEDEIDQADWFSDTDISLRVAENDARLTESFKLIWRQFVAHE